MWVELVEPSSFEVANMKGVEPIEVEHKNKVDPLVGLRDLENFVLSLENH